MSFTFIKQAYFKNAHVLSHVYRVSDVYVNLVLKKEKYIFLGRIGLNFWGFGEQLN